MDILISISDEPKNPRLIHHFDNPYMPKTVANPYYILEIREPDPIILNKIKQLMPLIEKQFGRNDEYIFEHTSSGFKLKKRMDEESYDQDSWDKWNKFSHTLYEEIAKAIGLETKY
jgi:hypothetical protein